MICDDLRSGTSPINAANNVEAGIKGITMTKAVLLVHAAQDYLCPDTK